VNRKDYEIKQKVYFLGAYKWIALGLFLLLIFCLTVKCCDFDKSSNSLNSNNNASINAPDHTKYRYLPPNEYIRQIPIDSSQVEQDKEDPLGRYSVKELLNVYLKENVSINVFLANLKSIFPQDSIIANYYAEAYKRVQIKINEDRKDFIKNKLKQDTANVKFVTYEWVYRNSTIKNDPGFNDPKNKWFYEDIGVFEVWKKTKGNPSIKIAVLDDGFDLGHIEIKNNYNLQWNVFDYTSKVYSNPNYQFHGTHVAGTIIGEQGNNYGISGVAPMCTLIPIQISNGSGIITTSSILDGIFYALNNDADIINLSLGFSFGSIAQELTPVEQDFIRKSQFKDEQELWEEVFEIAKNEGVVIVQAAGNDNIYADVDPMKRSENTIVVGAFDENFTKAEFSNYGNKINVYAPGTKIYSSLPGNRMGYLDGTSMATPIVSGCIALYMSLNPKSTIPEIIDVFSKQNDLGIPFNIHDLINPSL
jgi:subtilisin family serine protease